MVVADIVGNLPVEVLYYTDPACPWSWGWEPKLRRLLWELGESLRLRPVMAGLRRQYDSREWREIALEWLEAASASGMPVDPLVWGSSPLTSTYPACMAVKAAEEQGPEAGARYLRRLREGLMAERRRLDHGEALIAAAGEAGLDTARFRIDLDSPAITEAFGADLELTREGGHDAPSLVFAGSDGAERTIHGLAPYEECREAALACGAEVANPGPLDPLDAVDRFGRVATVEAEELSGRPAPVVRAELWAAAREWRLKPAIALTGELWEKA
jgi:putative protein-disulfide isomerase